MPEEAGGTLCIAADIGLQEKEHDGDEIALDDGGETLSFAAC